MEDLWEIAVLGAMVTINVSKEGGALCHLNYVHFACTIQFP